MSEAITKACDNPVCINGHMYRENNSDVLNRAWSAAP